ncbi:hypothetical protein CJ469_02587 [Nocardia farcinica]|nr:hypothetical protein CJ469_02587 [Nocardia farcinica]
MAVGRRHDHLGAHDQRGEQLPHRGVEGERRLVQHHVGLVETALGDLPRHLVDHRGMGDRHALRTAGGAGGVEHVGGVLRAHHAAPFGRVDRAVGVTVQVEGVDVQHRAVAAGHVVAGGGQQHHRARAGQHVLGALGRVIGIDRHVAAARGHRRVHRDQHVQRTPDADRDQGVGADALLDQLARQPIHSRGELAVGQRGRRAVLALGAFARIEEQRGGMGAPARGRVEQLDHRGDRRHLVRGAVPAGQHRLALGGIEDLDVADRRARLARDRAQHPQESVVELLDRGPVEQIGRVGQHRRDARGRTGARALLGQRPQQVELGDGHLDLGGAHRQAGQLQGPVRHLLERQHHLEQRVPRLRAGRVEHLDQPLERHVGVRERLQIGFPCASEEFGERLAAVDVRAQHQGVDEHADQVVERLLAAARDRGADGDVGGARQPAHQHRQRGVHDHEQAHALGAGQLRQLRVQFGVDLEMRGGAAEALHRRTRAVGGQLELIGQPGQLPPPVGDLARGHRLRIGLRAEQLPLPDAVVLVLHRQRRPLRRLARGAGQVGGCDVTRERAEGEAVGGDVVHHEGDRVIGGAVGGPAGHPEDPHPDRQLARHVEPGGREFGQGGGQFALVDRLHGDRQVDLVVRDHLLVAAVPGLGEDRAQRLLARHHVVERGLQRRDVDVAAQPDHERQVVGRRGRVELVDEPHPLLRERQRHPVRQFLGDQRRATALGRRGVLGARGDTGHGGRLEQCAHTDLGAERGADAGHHLGGDQRVAAQVEEVVVDADPVLAEHVGEDVRYDLLGLGARGAVAGVGGEHRFRQRLAVELAGGVERERVQHHHRGGHHVAGQVLGGEAGQLQRVDALAGGGHHVRDQLLAGGGVHDEHRGLADRRMGQRDGLDLAELDPLTAELHLEVGAADVLQRARGVPAHQVAGAVHARARRTERVGDEPVRGEVGPAAVAAGQLPTAQVQLAGSADRGRAQPRIQHVHLDVPLRDADRHGDGVGRGGLPVRHRDGGLGGAVEVVQARAVGGERAELRGRLRRQRLTDDEHRAQALHLRRGGVRDEHRQHRRHEVGDGHPVPGDHVGDVERIAVPVGRGDHQFRAHHQRQEVAPQRDVEGGRGLLQVHVVRGQPVLVEHPQLLVDDRVMGHGHALGAAGGTRGVDDVGGVLRAQRGAPVGVGQRLRRVRRHVQGVDLDAAHRLR